MRKSKAAGPGAALLALSCSGPFGFTTMGQGGGQEHRPLGPDSTKEKGTSYMQRHTATLPNPTVLGSLALARLPGALFGDQSRLPGAALSPATATSQPGQRTSAEDKPSSTTSPSPSSLPSPSQHPSRGPPAKRDMARAPPPLYPNPWGSHRPPGHQHDARQS